MSGWKSTLRAFGSSAANAVKRAAANKSVRSAVKKGLEVGVEFAAVSAVGALVNGSEGAREAARQHALQSLSSFAGVPDVTSEVEVADYMRETDNRMKIDVLQHKLDDTYKDSVLALEAAKVDADNVAITTQKLRFVSEQEKKMETSVTKLKKQIMGVEQAETDDGKRLVKRITTLAGAMEKELDGIRNDNMAMERIDLREKVSSIASDLLGEVPEVGIYMRSAMDAADTAMAVKDLTSLGYVMEGEKKEVSKNISAVLAGIEGDVHRAAYRSIDEERSKTGQSKADRQKVVGVRILDEVVNKVKSIHEPAVGGVSTGRVKSGGLYGFIGGFGMHEVAVWCYYSPDVSSEMFVIMFDALSVRLMFRMCVVKSGHEAMSTIRSYYAEFVKGVTGSVDLLHDSVQIQHTSPVLVGRFGDPGYERVSENYYNLRKHMEVVLLGTATHVRRMISEWLVNGPIVHERVVGWGD